MGSTRFRQSIAATSTNAFLKVGAPLDRALMQSSREAIVDELKDHGYPNPDVTTWSPAARAIAEGRYLHREAGQRSLRRQHPDPGNVERQPENCRAAADVPAGQLRREQAARSQPVCNGFQLRKHRSVESGTCRRRRTNAPERIATRVTVTEGKHRKVNFGAGYGTEEKARGEIDWRHVNSLAARARRGYSRVTRTDRVRLNFKQPFLQAEIFVRHERPGISAMSPHAN
jgi:hypothetical protein